MHIIPAIFMVFFPFNLFQCIHDNKENINFISVCKSYKSEISCVITFSKFVLYISEKF